MKERPILFSAPMVRAILAGTKTQTRRVVKPQPDGDSRPLDGEARVWPFSMPSGTPEGRKLCPYGVAGDRLWVRETWSKAKSCNCSDIFYRADGETSGKQTALSFIDREARWRPSIHMPRWASRLTLEITGVRVERLQDISREDAVKEGLQRLPTSQWVLQEGEQSPHLGGASFTHGHRFMRLWESINGADSWAANPWVRVIEFKRVTP